MSAHPPLRHIPTGERNGPWKFQTYCGQWVRADELLNRPQGIAVTCPACAAIEAQMMEDAEDITSERSADA
jgi:hypothetical protein